MKKTNPKVKPEEAQSLEAAPPGKTRQHGPQKEKTQVTIRIDKELMDRVYAQIKQDNARLTDVIEEGLILALKQRDENMPKLTHRVRFLVANTTKTQQQQIEGFLTLLAWPHLEQVSPTDMLLRAFFLNFLELLKTAPDRRERAQEFYSRYGRTEEDLEQIAGS